MWLSCLRLDHSKKEKEVGSQDARCVRLQYHCRGSRCQPGPMGEGAALLKPWYELHGPGSSAVPGLDPRRSYVGADKLPGVSLWSASIDCQSNWAPAAQLRSHSFNAGSYLCSSKTPGAGSGRSQGSAGRPPHGIHPSKELNAILSCDENR